MRVFRLFLLGALLCTAAAVPMFADHLEPNCPLSYIGGTSAATAFGQSPHAVFRNGSMVYFLRGQTLTTYSTDDVGEIQVARQDFMSDLAARDPDGGVAFNNGFLFVSSDAGLEIYDLRNVRAGGAPPVLVSRTPGLHYRRLAVSGNLLVGLYPMTDMPCLPRIPGSNTNPNPECTNSLDIWSIADMTAPALMSQIPSTSPFYGFNDVAWANGYLYATGVGGTWAFDLSDASKPRLAYGNGVAGTFLATNGTNFLAIGQDKQIGVFLVGPAYQLGYFGVYPLPAVFDRSNDIVFHPEAYIDSQRLITMVDERDPATGDSARTLAFDVFDFSIPIWEGREHAYYENVSLTQPDERKFDPIAVGPYVYVIGEISGLQTWGACGTMAGAIDFRNLGQFTCGGSEVHGWVTSSNKITQVQLYLDSTLLGSATLGSARQDVSSRTPATAWNLSVNLDDTAQGVHTLRAVGTDVNGNTRQFASRDVYFYGPGHNCTSRRRGTKR
ncbi:MAG: hypothetical protein WBX15_01465 [Thermoanaerobaculia bacterium]